MSFKRKRKPRREAPKPVQQTLEWQLKTPIVESPRVETPSYTENVREKWKFYRSMMRLFKQSNAVEPVEQEGELVDSHDDHADYLKLAEKIDTQPLEKEFRITLFWTNAWDLLICSKRKRLVYD